LVRFFLRAPTSAERRGRGGGGGGGAAKSSEASFLLASPDAPSHARTLDTDVCQLQHASTHL
jgi:hypothetical protein